MIADKINLDARNGTECTAYVLQDNDYLVLVANVVGATPTYTPDGTKVVTDIAYTNYIAEVAVESETLYKVPITDVTTKPTVLVERNAGTDKNFLY